MIIRTTTLISVLLLSAAAAQAQVSTPLDTAYLPGDFQVFTGSGTRATLDDVVQAMATQQVVFIGEAHDDPTGHMLQLQLLQRADSTYGGTAASARSVVLSLEFFERDVQLPLDEYLAGLIPEPAFLAAARPWPRYQSDYRPMVEYSREHSLPVIAANAPRRYVSMVAREGREALNGLDEQALRFLPPLPFPAASPTYRDQWISTMSSIMELEGMRCGVPVEHAAAPAGAHQNMGNQLHSQVLWDASMAHAIARHLASDPSALVLHMVGGFHVARGTGTPEQLQHYMPGARSIVVLLRPVDDVDAFEPAPDGEWGDFVIQTEKARTLEAIECREFRAERTK